MWISKNILKIKDENEKACEGVITQSADRRISVNASHGVGRFGIVAPPGIICVPSSKQDAVVIPTDMGKICVGVRIPYNNYELEPGEIMLYAGSNTTLIMRTTGEVILKGNLTVTGTINGKEI